MLGLPEIETGVVSTLPGVAKVGGCGDCSARSLSWPEQSRSSWYPTPRIVLSRSASGPSALPPVDVRRCRNRGVCAAVHRRVFVSHYRQQVFDGAILAPTAWSI